MKNFILGVIVTMLLLGLGGLGIAMLGLMPTAANVAPPQFERRIAMTALDASMDRHAPRVHSPLAPTPENLIDGMKIYTMNCALCHGTLNLKTSPLAHSFYPPVPQLILHPLDDPEWHIAYAIRTGVRYTGMPAWEKTLTDEEIWKTTAFLANVEKLPPPAREFWKPSFGVEPPQEGKSDDKGGEKEDHD